MASCDEFARLRFSQVPLSVLKVPVLCLMPDPCIRDSLSQCLPRGARRGIARLSVEITPCFAHCSTQQAMRCRRMALTRAQPPHAGTVLASEWLVASGGSRRAKWPMKLIPTKLLASWLAAAGLLALSAEASAQSKGKGNDDGKGQDKPTIGQRPTVIPRDPASDPATAADQKGKPATPGRPDKTQPPADVQTLVRDFQTAREKFLTDQKALARQYNEASEEERKAIRERMKEILERLKEQQKAVQQDMRDRAKELKQQLHPDLNRLIDNGTTEGGRGR